MNKCRITVFTPTYNRAHVLRRCYESLVAQTSQDFVWLLVDDGSEDETEALVRDWQKDGAIDIQYIKQNNGGKHTAHNTAVKSCQTDYILILDSDDFLDKKCIETLGAQIDDIDASDSVCGIIGSGVRWGVSDESYFDKVLSSGIKYASGLELYQKYNYAGETMRLYKTKILKRFLFPEIPGEKFIYENVVFDQIDAQYKMLIIQDRLYYGDYLEDGYTANAKKVKLNNPKGYALSLDSSIKYSLRMSKKVNWTILYIIWCKRMNIHNAFFESSSKLLYVAAYPIAVICILLKKPKFFFDIFTDWSKV